MILSYHPLFSADNNLLCAGRAPDQSDLEAIRAADAVILPQGATEALYRLARKNCPHVFPNLATRFDYPGKSGQIRLFRSTEIPHPESRVYHSLDGFYQESGYDSSNQKGFFFSFPLVVKMNWGGEGEGIAYVKDHRDLDDTLNRIRQFEETGQKGFLLQEYVEGGEKTLRVVVIGKKRISYWRIQDCPEIFGAHISKGARIDHGIFPDHQCAGKEMVATFCEKTGINLAGLDIIFQRESFEGNGEIVPYMLEINYYFGRRGLGGSDAYYELLESSIRSWLDETLRI